MHRTSRTIAAVAAAAVLPLAAAACGGSSPSASTAAPAPGTASPAASAATPPATRSPAAQSPAAGGPAASAEPDAEAAPTGAPDSGTSAGVPASHQHSLTFIALGDGGASGMPVGCGDSAVPVTVTTTTIAPLGEVYRAQLGTRERDYGASGLYNALAASDLTYQSATISDGHATVHLTGDLTMGGECDIPRVRAQLTEPALQFPNVDTVDVDIDGTPLDVALSLR
ncbi:GerMN domain-containing protein [Tomitella fengzijianii]|uniref:GerMN domain-containing protein n=1 Tax=Tomitella fengzijianii TaxID=2597660 RepID=A0A516X1E2_9ACTN|nr:GerMN domain-containing protein [Tomitella fengzijianii]QDQ96902.1 GerMN domain-containing protein [Tomitella fengzijianii]